MDSNSIFDLMISDIKQFKDGGKTDVNLDSLLIYMQKMKDQIGPNHDFSLETFKAQHQINIEEMKLNEAIRLESFRSTINVGINAAKSCMLINGGASVALLAFIGNIWSKGSIEIAALLVSKGLLIFCSGVFLAALCSGFTYLAQSAYTSSELGKNKKWAIWGGVSNFIAIFSALSSLIVFGLGSYQTYLSMVSQFTGQ